MCEAIGCVHAPAAGMRAVTCRLERIETAVRTATPGDVGGAVAQSRLLARIAGVQRTIHAAEEPGTPRARGPLKRAVRQLRSFSSAVGRARRLGRMRPDLAARLMETAADAVSHLLPLLRPR